MSAPARGSCSADVGYDDHHHCHTLFRILENDDCFRRQGPDAAGCFLGGKALRLPSLPPFAGFFFFFFWHSCSQVWEGFLDRGPQGSSFLKTCSSGHSGHRFSNPGPLQEAAAAAAWSFGGPTWSSASSPS